MSRGLRCRLAFLALLTSGACSGSSSPFPTSGPIPTAALTLQASPSPSPLASPVKSPSIAASPAGGGQETKEQTFTGSSSGIDRSRLQHSWREGCPVGIEDLRLLTLTHWGFDGEVHTGELVVHRDQASKVLGAMRKLFEARFPIEKMELVDRYQADDDRSMDANNTSAFNCREVEARPGVWSQHSYGTAIDINPIQNPYVSSGEVSPAAGAVYADRSKRSPGMIHAGGAVVKAFASIGWKWGGYWSSSKDYQHFSSNGR